jgi:transposase
VLFEDETDLRLFPNLRATWAKRGQSAPVVLSGFNAKRVIFGALNFRTGHRLLLARPRQRQEDFQTFLSYLRRSYRRWDLLLVLDEDSCHTAKKSRQLAESLGIELEWLPARSPKLNPLDTLWGQAKDEVCANWQYDNIEEQTKAFLSYIDQLSNRKTLHTTGILSGNFWLT